MKVLNRKGVRRCRLAAGLLALVLAGSQAAGADLFDLSWFTIDGGGATSTGGGFELTGTIGQPDAGILTGGGYELTGGFWNTQLAVLSCTSFAAADFDLDCDVDSDDLSAFALCASRRGVPHPGGCAVKDFDHDGDVDLEDFARFQRCYSGQGRAAIPTCAD